MLSAQCSVIQAMFPRTSPSLLPSEISHSRFTCINRLHGQVLPLLRRARIRTLSDYVATAVVLYDFATLMKRTIFTRRTLPTKLRVVEVFSLVFAGQGKMYNVSSENLPRWVYR